MSTNNLGIDNHLVRYGSAELSTARRQRLLRATLNSMKASLDWNEGLTFAASIPSGAELTFDNANDGDAPKGPSPMEGLLTSLAACTAMDVVSILHKKRQNVTSYRVEIEGDRNPPGEWPRPFTEFRIKHIVRGDVEPAALQRAVTLSEETYCSVSATLRVMPKVVNTWEIE